jgi:dienelactone hydrolase
MVLHLLALPNSPIDCGVICHPSPDPSRYPKIQNPSSWHLASDDMSFKPKNVNKLKEVMEKRAAEGVVFECEVHPGALVHQKGKEKLI